MGDVLGLRKRMCFTALDLFIPLVHFIQCDCPNSHSRQWYLGCRVKRFFYWKHIRIFAHSLLTLTTLFLPVYLLISFLSSLLPKREGVQLISPGSWPWLRTSLLPLIDQGSLLFLSQHQKGSPGELPNLPRNLHEWHINHCCAKPLNFWVGLLLGQSLAHPDEIYPSLGVPAFPGVEAGMNQPHPSLLPRALCVSISPFLPPSPSHARIPSPNFTSKEPEVQRGKTTCPKPHSTPSGIGRPRHQVPWLPNCPPTIHTHHRPKACNPQVLTMFRACHTFQSLRVRQSRTR